MSDVSSHEQDLTAEGPEADAGLTSVGFYLAGQRRLRGVSVDELAARTRIPRRNIERLEAGAFDAAPDGFSRGFVRTVAVALGLDADEAVTRLMAEPRADDSMLVHERRARMLVRAAVLGTALLVGVVGWRLIATLAAPGSDGSVSAVVYRPDPVRALALSQSRLRQAEATQRAAPVVPESD